MRYHVRNKVLELLPTFLEAIKYINKTELQQSWFLINDIKTGIDSIRKTFEESFTSETFSDYEYIMFRIEESLIEITRHKEENERINKEIKVVKDSIDDIQSKLLNEPEVKLEILFIPYKYSMWDSLESIWKASKDDPRCNVHVMPIPYYNRDEDGMLAEFHYEIESFIYNDIQVVSYKEFDYTVIRPDIIYYHNPFDGNNKVTSVSPEFYTNELKYYTDMMVYVPYFVAGSNIADSIQKELMPGEINANKIITISEKLKEKYLKQGINKEKVLSLGSPKIDYMINKTNEKNIPKKWKGKVEGKKVILLNSSIGRLLNEDNYITSLRETIELILEKEDIVLIWRPHPLLEATIKSMKPNMWEDYKIVKKLVESKAIMDTFTDFKYAVSLSDGMISDHSALARSYIATGKPLLFLEKSATEESEETPINFYASYFINDGITIKDFLIMILNNQDINKEIRLSKFKASIKNSNGEAGKEIHNYIVNSRVRDLKL